MQMPNLKSATASCAHGHVSSWYACAKDAAYCYHSELHSGVYMNEPHEPHFTMTSPQKYNCVALAFMKPWLGRG